LCADCSSTPLEPGFSAGPISIVFRSSFVQPVPCGRKRRCGTSVVQASSSLEHHVHLTGSNADHPARFGDLPTSVAALTRSGHRLISLSESTARGREIHFREQPSGFGRSPLLGNAVIPRVRRHFTWPGWASCLLALALELGRGRRRARRAARLVTETVATAGSAGDRHDRGRMDSAFYGASAAWPSGTSARTSRSPSA